MNVAGGMNIERCLNACANAKYSLAGVEYSVECCENILAFIFNFNTYSLVQTVEMHGRTAHIRLTLPTASMYIYCCEDICSSKT